MKWTAQLERFFKNKKNVATTIVEQDKLEQPTQIIKPLPIDFNLKMLIITDTHGCLKPEDIPDCDADVCFLLGDIFLHELAIIKEKVTNMPIYGVLGNHDGFELYEMAGIENIHGKVVEVNGVKVAGFQGSFRYKNTYFPFYDDDESVEIADCIERADILISHDSPKHFHVDQDWAHSGLQGITHYCEKLDVPLNIHGHFHENMSGVLENGTRVVCCFGVQIVDTKEL